MVCELEDVACALCGCVCDDLTVRTQNDRIVAADRACEKAAGWFLAQSSARSEVHRVRGRAESLDAAIELAADILRQASHPLIYGLSRSSTPGQAAAVRLADLIGANIDTTASTCHAPSIMALQAAGESTCSLGEVRQRSDLVIYWGSNPVVSHPRHIERFVDSTGRDAPRGRADRRLVVVDVQPTETTALADTFLRVNPGGDFEALWALRALLRGLPVDVPSAGGVSIQDLASLAEQIRSSRYAAVFFGLGLTKHGLPHANVEALLRLVTDAHAYTRAIARRMRVPGDVAGADSVLCWQTGYPFSVNLARGYPRFNPGEFTANQLLERGEVDAVLLVGAEGVPRLSVAARASLSQIPTIVLDYPGASRHIEADVQFATAIYGIHRAGTAYRMDEVPVPLRPVLTSPLPSDHEVLEAITVQLSRSIG